MKPRPAWFLAQRVLEVVNLHVRLSTGTIKVRGLECLLHKLLPTPRVFGFLCAAGEFVLCVKVRGFWSCWASCFHLSPVDVSLL